MDNRERRVEFFRRFKQEEKDNDRRPKVVFETKSFSIEKEETPEGEKFYCRNTFYDSFEEAFERIARLKGWYRETCYKLAPQYSAYVLKKFLAVLNQMRVSPSEFRLDTRPSWEYHLLGKDIDRQLIYDENAPCRQQIKIIPLKIIETKVYDYDESMSEYIIENGFKYLLIKTDKTITYREEHDTWEYIGIAEVSGNTIIIKNRMGQIVRTFPSDKYLLEAEPYDTYPERWYVLE